MDKVPLPFALSLQRIAFALFSQRYTGAHIGCLPGVTPRSSAVSAFGDSVSPFLQVWSEFVLHRYLTWGCVQVWFVWMDLAYWWSRLLAVFPVVSPTNCVSYYFLLFDPGWKCYIAWPTL